MPSQPTREPSREPTRQPVSPDYENGCCVQGSARQCTFSQKELGHLKGILRNAQLAGWLRDWLVLLLVGWLASQPPADSPAAPASAAAALAWMGRCRREARKNNIRGIIIIICTCWPAGWLAVWLVGQLLARWWTASKQQKLNILQAQMFHFLC